MILRTEEKKRVRLNDCDLCMINITAGSNKESDEKRQRTAMFEVGTCFWLQFCSAAWLFHEHQRDALQNWQLSAHLQRKTEELKAPFVSSANQEAVRTLRWTEFSQGINGFYSTSVKVPDRRWRVLLLDLHTSYFRADRVSISMQFVNYHRKADDLHHCSHNRQVVPDLGVEIGTRWSLPDHLLTANACSPLDFSLN